MTSNTLFLKSTKSTNSRAFQLADSGKPHGFSIIAEQQTCGRGRLEREWFSPAGKGLYCSIILRPNLSPEDFPLITLTAGLAVCEAVESVCGLSCMLKWPNDIFVNGKKCGGILVETSSFQGKAEDVFVVVGIGLNVNTDYAEFPDQLRVLASSFKVESGSEHDIKTIFHKVRKNLL